MMTTLRVSLSCLRLKSGLASPGRCLDAEGPFSGCAVALSFLSLSWLSLLFFFSASCRDQPRGQISPAGTPSSRHELL